MFLNNCVAMCPPLLRTTNEHETPMILSMSKYSVPQPLYDTATTATYYYYYYYFMCVLTPARPPWGNREREKMNTARRRQLFFFDVLQLRRRRRHLLLRTLLHPTISLKSFPVKGERIGIGISSSLLIKQATRSFFLRRGAGFSFFSWNKKTSLVTVSPCIVLRKKDK